MKDYICKSKTNILNDDKIENNVQSINMTSMWQRRKIVEYEMMIKNFSESSIASCNKHLQKSKHQNAESWNIYIWTSYRIRLHCAVAMIIERERLNEFARLYMLIW